MGRPAREELLSFRNGNVEIVVRLTAHNKRAAQDLRPAAEQWLSRPDHPEALQQATLAWLTMFGSFLKDVETESTRQQPLPFGDP